MSIKQLLLDLPNWLIFAFVVANMLALGMELTVTEVVTPLRDLRLTLKSLVANFVLVPLTAYGLVQGLGLEHGFALGLILMACSAGDPFVTKLSQSAKGDTAFSLAVMAMLSIMTCVYMPVVLPLLLPGIKVDPVEIVKPLLILILAPLSVGFVVRAKAPKQAERFAPPLDKLASILIYTAVALFAAVHYADIVAAFGMHAILAAILLVASAALYGYVLGGPQTRHRSDLAVNTAWRGVSAGLAVGIKNFPNEHNLFTMAIIIVLVSSLILMPLSATYFRRRNMARSGGVLE